MNMNLNANNIMQQLSQFQQQIMQQGIDPKAMVQQLLNSGRMSQEQFNQLRAIVNQITGNRL